MPGTARGIFILSLHFNTLGLGGQFSKWGKPHLRKVKTLNARLSLGFKPLNILFHPWKLCCIFSFRFPLSSWFDILPLKRQILVFPFRLILSGCPFPSGGYFWVWFSLKKVGRRHGFISYSWPGDQLHPCGIRGCPRPQLLWLWWNNLLLGPGPWNEWDQRWGGW